MTYGRIQSLNTLKRPKASSGTDELEWRLRLTPYALADNCYSTAQYQAYHTARIKLRSYDMSGSSTFSPFFRAVMNDDTPSTSNSSADNCLLTEAMRQSCATVSIVPVSGICLCRAPIN